MRRLALAALLGVACGFGIGPLDRAIAQSPGDRGPASYANPPASFANPSAVIGAEIAFNQLAQAKGQWSAFRDTAAQSAIMFVPERVNARDWLKGRADPPVAVKWQPHEVWMSCDGSYAVTRGAWQRPGSTGFFTTIWQRQPKRGDYRWLLDLGDSVTSPLPAPEMIVGKVAVCIARPTGRAPGAGSPPVRRKRSQLAQPAIDPANGQSDDATLRWVAVLDAKGAGHFTASRWTGTAYQEVLTASFRPQA